MPIAFDASAQGYVISGTSLTWPHTCAGLNRILFVSINRDSATDAVTGVTYNGVPMTLIDSQSNGSDRNSFLFYLIAPAIGTHDIVVSGPSGSSGYFGESASYTGARQTSQPDASTKIANSGSPYTTTLTVVANNSWTILGTASSTTTPTASTGSFKRQDNATTGGEKIFDSNGVVPSGSYSMVLTGSGGNIVRVMASFAPAEDFLEDSLGGQHASLQQLKFYKNEVVEY